MTHATTSAGRRRRVARAQSRRTTSRRRFVTTGAIAATGLSLGAAGWWRYAIDDDGSGATGYASIPVHGRVLGDPSAPLRLVEHGDYLCIHCAHFASEAQPRLIEDFVRSGQLAYEFRPMPVLGGNVTAPGNPAVLAAEASLCALDQGAYWPFHDRAFAPTLDREQERMNREFLVGLAGEIGLDTDVFAASLDGGTHRQEVIDFYNQGIALGLSGVPSFFLDDRAVIWPASGYDEFRPLLEEVLSAS